MFTIAIIVMQKCAALMTLMICAKMNIIAVNAILPCFTMPV